MFQHMAHILNGTMCSVRPSHAPLAIAPLWPSAPSPAQGMMEGEAGKFSMRCMVQELPMVEAGSNRMVGKQMAFFVAPSQHRTGSRIRRRRTFKELSRDYGCPHGTCPRRYATRSSLATHIRLKHDGEMLASARAPTSKDTQSAPSSPQSDALYSPITPPRKVRSHRAKSESALTARPPPQATVPSSSSSSAHTALARADTLPLDFLHTYSPDPFTSPAPPRLLAHTLTATPMTSDSAMTMLLSPSLDDALLLGHDLLLGNDPLLLLGPAAQGGSMQWLDGVGALDALELESIFSELKALVEPQHQHVAGPVFL